MDTAKTLTELGKVLYRGISDLTTAIYSHKASVDNLAEEVAQLRRSGS